MKRNLSARETARQMAKIMVEHLETLPTQERNKKIEAGKKVLKASKTTSSPVTSGSQSKVSLSGGISHFPLAARGR